MQIQKRAHILHGHTIIAHCASLYQIPPINSTFAKQRVSRAVIIVLILFKVLKKRGDPLIRGRATSVHHSLFQNTDSVEKIDADLTSSILTGVFTPLRYYLALRGCNWPVRDSPYAPLVVRLTRPIRAVERS